jgi:thioredoxin 1
MRTRNKQDMNDHTTAGHPSHSRTLPTDAVRNIHGDTFDTMVLAAKGPVAVEFMSYSCAHCAAVEPILQQVAQTIHADEAVFRVNVVSDEELAAAYGIQGTPTFVMFLDGREVGRVEGPHPGLHSVMAAVTQPFAS